MYVIMSINKFFQDLSHKKNKTTRLRSPYHDFDERVMLIFVDFHIMSTSKKVSCLQKLLAAPKTQPFKIG